MNNPKPTLLTLILFISAFAKAQTNSWEPPEHFKPGLSISLNANLGKSNSEGIINELGFNPNISLEYNWNKFGIGMELGSFTTNTTMNYREHLSPFEKFTAFKVDFEKTNWTTNYILIGPHYNISLSKNITLTTSFKMGVTDNKGPQISINDISTNPAQSLLEYLPPYKTKRFAINPKINLGFKINKKVDLVANLGYLNKMGGDRYTAPYGDVKWINFNLSAAEVKAQILNAPKKESLANGPLQYISFGIGLKYNL
jgi:hypothetical protein